MIFGGAGFIGSALSRQLEKNPIYSNHFVVVDDFSMTGEPVGNLPSHVHRVDCSEVREVVRLLETYQPTHVVHLAANSDIRKSFVNPNADLKNTYRTSVAIALAIAQLGRIIENFVFASSSAIFGLKEEKIVESTVGIPESPYGWMKLSSEELFSSLYELELIKQMHLIRFPNVTGQGQTHGVVKDLVEKYLDHSRPFEILGDGSQDKPYVHVDDLIAVILGHLYSDSASGLNLLNVSPEDSITVREIVELIQERGQIPRQPKFGDKPYGWTGDVPRYSYDTAKLRSLGHVLRSSKSAITTSIDEEFIKHGR